MESSSINIDPQIAKILLWAQKSINIFDPYSYDKDYIIDIANYISKEHLSYNVDSFTEYANQLNFPTYTINVFIKEIEKAQKRKSHPVKYMNIKHILSV